jgi:hypothetical protein
MRTLKRMGSALLSTLLLLSLTLFAWADQQEPYTYRVTFHAGAQGTMVGDQVEVRGKGYHIERSQDAITVTGLHLGDRVTWDNDAVAPTEDHRYYVRGVRLSGHDNDTVDATSFVVKEDRDYVVAYGIRGETVAYKVRFTDTNGKDLRKSRTMHGNVGDKPVVASLYIEGYLPQAYNLTGTLKADESKNVFTFVYRKVTAAESTETGNNNNNGNTGTNNTGNNNNGNTGTAGNAGTNNNGNTDGAGTTGDTQTQTEQGNQPAAQGGEENGNTTAPEEVPEIIDIDDEEVPLANAEGAETSNETEASHDAIQLGVVLRAVLVLTALAAVGAAIWWKVAGRKKKN